MSLNICCLLASQLVTKNPPDRVVMIMHCLKLLNHMCQIIKTVAKTFCSCSLNDNLYVPRLVFWEHFLYKIKCDMPMVNDLYLIVLLCDMNQHIDYLIYFSEYDVKMPKKLHGFLLKRNVILLPKVGHHTCHTVTFTQYVTWRGQIYNMLCQKKSKTLMHRKIMRN